VVAPALSDKANATTPTPRPKFGNFIFNPFFLFLTSVETPGGKESYASVSKEVLTDATKP
jgi:hypothetical protein